VLRHGPPPAAPPRAVTVLAGVGKAAGCQLAKAAGPHPARRWVWHHILPQACGGRTVKANLASLCDSCHYAVHSLMWELAWGITPGPAYTPEQMALARQGYQAAVDAGTVAKMPKEGD
jgi:hypothetical protein